MRTSDDWVRPVVSYDVWINADLGGLEPLCIGDWNYTSNVAEMWRAAGADLAKMDDMACTDARPILKRALEVMRADPERYRAMDPPNGWGDYEGCMEFLQAILDACDRYPQRTRLRVSH